MLEAKNLAEIVSSCVRSVIVALNNINASMAINLLVIGGCY